MQNARTSQGKKAVQYPETTIIIECLDKLLILRSNKERARKKSGYIVGGIQCRRYLWGGIQYRRYLLGGIQCRRYLLGGIQCWRYLLGGIESWRYSFGGIESWRYFLAVSRVGGTSLAEAVKPKYGGKVFGKPPYYRDRPPGR